ncbi:MAG: sigma-54 dependent transcriptional regulator [Acidobacteriia bacterium]|nr:sigma-54 dependent transcriptional regulator [Terriglobia bacterium]
MSVVMGTGTEPQTRTPARANILVVDDEAEIRESLEMLLNAEGYSVSGASNGEEGLQRLRDKDFDVVLLDVMMPGKNGLEVLKEIRALDRDVAVVMITAFGSVENAIAAIRSGAHDFITKPWDNDKLLIDVENAVRNRRLLQENVQLKRALKERYNFPNIIGKSERMLKIFDLVTQVASSRSTVMIQGESGTGKELIAKAVHSISPRADRPFIPVNTGSLPADLLESNLFGHEKGAFTSAVASKKGLFEVADTGTIFFDEIGLVGLETQAKLLRVIQEREFMRLGGVETIKVDVRIIAATNEDLKGLVTQGKFRDDLFYRLNVIAVQLPPLRERKEDIPLLVEHFIQKYCEDNGRPAIRFTAEAMKALMDHNWPGNVRELENAVERAVVLSTTPWVDVSLLPESIFESGVPGNRTLQNIPFNENATLFDILDSVERRVIVDVLEKVAWSQTNAAERLGVPLSTLNQKIKRLNIEIKRRREA